MAPILTFRCASHVRKTFLKAVELPGARRRRTEVSVLRIWLLHSSITGSLTQSQKKGLPGSASHLPLAAENNAGRSRAVVITNTLVRESSVLDLIRGEAAQVLTDVRRPEEWTSCPAARLPNGLEGLPLPPPRSALRSLQPSHPLDQGAGSELQFGGDDPHPVIW
jgi:hypothetical protein